LQAAILTDLGRDTARDEARGWFVAKESKMQTAYKNKVSVVLGRIFALYHRSSTSYQIC
jgi:hypothetical protein